MTAAPVAAPAYPVTLEVAPAASQSRLSVFFRPLLTIPHLIVLYILLIPFQLFTLISWFTIIIAGRYPAGMHSFNCNVLAWETRVLSYAWLLTGAYPPFALGDVETYPVRLQIEPSTTGRSRLTTFFRPILAIPSLIGLYVVLIVAYLLLIVGWFAAIFTGRVPGGIHTFIEGSVRWYVRYFAYAYLLTDRYPPFSLS